MGIAKVIVLQCEIEVDFTYKEEVLYLNNTTLTYEKTGIYRNLDAYQVDVTMQDLSSV